MTGEKTSFREQKEVYVVVGLLLLISLLYYHPTFFSFPSHLHAWTQSDRYALAMGYVLNGMNPFLPSTLNLFPKYPPELLGTFSGGTSAALPWPEYLAALIMRLSGLHHPAILKSVVFAFGLAGLTALYLLARKTGGTAPMALLASVFAFSSPVFTYYLAGFIPGIPALAMSFVAVASYVSYLKSKALRSFLLALAFFTLAVLLRPPFLMPFIALILVHFTFNRKSLQLKKELALLVLHIGIIAAFMWYDRMLQLRFGSMFNNGLLPAADLAGWMALMRKSWSNWALSYFSFAHYLLLTCLFLWIIYMTFKGMSHIHKQLLLISLLSLGAAVLYSFVMAQQFPAHDYYFLDSFFFPLVLLAATAFSMFDHRHIMKPAFVWVAVAGFSVWMLALSYSVQKARYITHSWDQVESTRLNFTGSEAFLEQHNIPAQARILVLDAYTSNAPLLLMNRLGFTVIETSASNITEALSWPFDYIAIQNSSLGSEILRNMPQLAENLDRVAGNGRITIFKYRNEKKKQSWTDLLLPAEEEGDAAVFLDSAVYCIAADEAFYALKDTLLPVASNGVTALLYKAAARLPDGDAKGLHVVLDAQGPGGFRFYKSHPVFPYFEQSNDSAGLMFFLQLPEAYPDSCHVKAYLWNRDKKVLCLKNQVVLLTKYYSQF